MAKAPGGTVVGGKVGFQNFVCIPRCVRYPSPGITVYLD